MPVSQIMMYYYIKVDTEGRIIEMKENEGNFNPTILNQLGKRLCYDGDFAGKDLEDVVSKVRDAFKNLE